MKQAITAVLYSPGTNCHEETAAAIELAGGKSEFVLLRDLLDGQARLDRYQAAVIPGGFSYGDYLRTGAVARFSPVMNAVQESVVRHVLKPLRREIKVLPARLGNNAGLLGAAGLVM